MPSFSSADGLTLSYRLWEQDSDLPLVVLHHGFAASGEANWVAPGVVDALRDAGRRVATIDARGHGNSEKPHDPAYFGEEKMATDVLTLLELLGESRVDLVGYSMGAVVSLLVAAREQCVRRLAVGGVGAAVVELGGVDSRVIGGANLIAALRADDPASIDDPPAAEFRAFADFTGADRLALAAQAGAMHQKPIELDRITAPTLLLAGDEDVFAARPEVLADAIPGARLCMVSGDHLGAVRAPTFTEEIISFLAK
ncbi:alpha/beta fold hydrolase [Salinactinospora qingdaonensis]|uniref:Alpha/beta hydrolase n=1 Tax=Salinactinospora qingdaonensis TaxID=702744 RepID=A0ABP7GG11_9ACTN